RTHHHTRTTRGTAAVIVLSANRFGGCAACARFGKRGRDRCFRAVTRTCGPARICSADSMSITTQAGVDVVVPKKRARAAAMVIAAALMIEHVRADALGGT
ncbi:hypothetical protein, partial [Rhodococcus wratislaviensis]